MRTNGSILACANTRSRVLLEAVAAILMIPAAACRQDMHDQPKYIPLRSSDFFGDGRSARPIPAGTVAQGHLEADAAYYTGKKPDGTFIESIPFAMTKDVVLRGQKRFNTFCSPCHDRTGTGMGMVVRRGFRRPPSYHIARLREAPDGYLFDVITNGFGAMPNYSAEIQPADRWAIATYIRALQLAQFATVNDVPVEARPKLAPGVPQ